MKILLYFIAGLFVFHHSLAQSNKKAKKWNSLGIEKIKLKQYAEASDAFSEAIKLDNYYSEAFNNRGIAIAFMEDYLIAIEDFTIAIQIDPKYTEAYYNRGKANLNLKKLYGSHKRF